MSDGDRQPPTFRVAYDEVPQALPVDQSIASVAGTSGVALLGLNAEEQAASECVVAYLNLVKSWGLQTNTVELVSAIHVLQSFIVQHMLERLAPGQWGSWFQTEVTPEPE